MEPFFRSASLLFAFLNPFFMSIYLLDLLQGLERRSFARVLTRACLISGVVFALFALLGDRAFEDIFQARFAAFLVFGGIIFLVISLRFVFSGVEALKDLRGPPRQLAGSIAMPFMIGPGTVSASVMIGARLPAFAAICAVAAAMLSVAGSLLVLKWLHDWVRRENERLVSRYVEVTGRVMALLMGTYSIDLIFRPRQQNLWVSAGSGMRPSW